MAVLLFLIAILFGLFVYSFFCSIRRPKKFPPGPKFVPWLGNTLQLCKDCAVLGGQHIVFEKWAEKYDSNVIGFKLGQELVVVVLSYSLVKYVHLQDVFEGRPDNFFLRLRTMGSRLGITCTDGKLWQEQRRFVMKQMRNLGYGRTQMETHIESEGNRLLEHIESMNGVSVWPGLFLPQNVLNVLWALIAGTCFERKDKRLLKLLDLLKKRSKAFDMCGGILSQFPWLRYIAPDKTGYTLVKKLNAELHDFFCETIMRHKEQISKKEKVESDLIFAFMNELNNRANFEKNSFNETQLTMIILDLFIAGSQTTSNTTDLALMMLALRPDIQDKISNEISSTMKFDEFPHLRSKSSLPYTEAFIMEVQRFFHIIPISGPRRTLWDTFLDGFFIPKNTTILIGLRSVLMDKKHWKTPECFKPERFLDKNGHIVKDDYFMPFGQGRRRCLGEMLARACIFSFLVIIVKRFKLQLCPNSNPSTLLQPGIVLTPKPYKIIFTKKCIKNINSKLY